MGNVHKYRNYRHVSPTEYSSEVMHVADYTTFCFLFLTCLHDSKQLGNLLWFRASVFVAIDKSCLFVTEHCSFKANEMGEACGTYGGGEKFVLGIDGENVRLVVALRNSA